MIRVVTLSFLILALPTTTNKSAAFVLVHHQPYYSCSGSSSVPDSASRAHPNKKPKKRLCYRNHLNSDDNRKNTKRSLVLSSTSSLQNMNYCQQQQQEEEEATSTTSLSWITSTISNAFVASAACCLACAILVLSSSLLPAYAEDELAAKYGHGKGLDTSLVDQTCLVNHCSLKAKACLADDPDCRKGLTCTAKCMGDNACITGCMARYGNSHLDDLLKCSIEDHGCIKVAILPGGADLYGQEPLPPAPTVQNFRMNSLEGTWYKVVGYNPNYDCYACQRNAFTKIPTAETDAATAAPWLRTSNDKLKVNVEFSMPRLLPEGGTTTTTTTATTVDYTSSVSKKTSNLKWLTAGSTNNNIAQPLGLNEYKTTETLVFDNAKTNSDNSNLINSINNLVLNAGKSNERSYARTAHSEGEMFGLKFWENWYVIGQNDPGQPEFKFIYYNGKTRQNTYDGAFVYSRTKELDMESMKKVYQIAKDAGMNPDQFCKIRNGCFLDEQPTKGREGYILPAEPLRGILASTKVSQLLGVGSVAAEEGKLLETILADQQQRLQLQQSSSSIANIKQVWWKEVGDYLEDPHRHFKVMESLRQTMDWPDSVKEPRSN